MLAPPSAAGTNGDRQRPDLAREGSSQRLKSEAQRLPKNGMTDSPSQGSLSRSKAGPASSSAPGSAIAMLARGSLGMGLGDANKSSSSLDGVSTYGGTEMEDADITMGGSSKPGEPSNIIIGPNGVLIPRSSILLNPSKRKSFVDAWRTVEGLEEPRLAPAVLRIKAVPTTKDREKERERQREEREREIEREWREKEQAEKVWGIPKKAFYMGLGEINFNAQMAMLGGWGNGSGGLYDFRPTPSTAIHRLQSTSSGSKTLTKRRSAGADSHKRRSSKSSAGSTGSSANRAHRKSTANQQPEQKSVSRPAPREPSRDSEASDSDESMDLEELAALNAIINTRRSMEAAQMLARGEQRPSAARRSLTNIEIGKERRFESINDMGTPKTVGDMDSTTSSKRPSQTDSPKTQQTGHTSSPRRPNVTRSISDQPANDTSRIRFAPLPHAYGPVPPSAFTSALKSDQQTSSNGHEQSSDIVDHQEYLLNGSRRLSEDGSFASYERADEKSIATESSESDSDDDSEPWRVRNSGSKSKWFLMSMSKGVFTAPSRKHRRPNSDMGAETAIAGELGTSPRNDKRLSTQSSADGERHTRRRGRSLKGSSRASSIKSRSSSVGSFDEEERDRRRQLIRASRPGGTGMVTLPDGTRIRARRVGEEDSDEESKGHWGFARLAREAKRQQADEEGDVEAAEDDEDTASIADAALGEDTTTLSPGSKRLSDDEVGRESDFERAVDEMDGLSSAKRRRRGRERAASVADPSGTALSLSHNADKASGSMADTDARPGAVEDRETQDIPMRYSPELLEDSNERDEDMLAAMPAAIKSADAVRAVKRSTTLPSGPISLSASQAAEVRRRHEQEVAALGAEVLQNIAKAKKARQQQMASEQKGKEQHAGANQPTPQQQHNQQSQTHNSSNVKAGTKPPQQGGTEQRPPPARAATLDENKSGHSSRKPLFGSLGRAASSRRPGLYGEQGNTIAEEEERQSTSTPEPPKMPHHISNEKPQSTPLRERRQGSGTTSPTRIQARQQIASATGEFQDQTDLSASMASVLDAMASDNANGVPSDQSEPELSQKDLQSDQLARGEAATISSQSPTDETGRKITYDNNFERTVSNRSMRSETRLTPQELPRRPDQRGYSVVPLPYDQLGRRPLRPVEGRFWQSSDDDDDDNDDKGDGDGDGGEEHHGIASEKRNRVPGDDREEPRRIHGRATGGDFSMPTAEVDQDDDDEADSDMNPEELAAEEWRTAQQKKRATTRAAGAEVVSTMAMSKNPTSPARRSLSRSRRATHDASARSSYFVASPKGLAPQSPDDIGAAVSLDDLNLSAQPSKVNKVGSTRPRSHSRPPRSTVTAFHSAGSALRPTVSTSVLPGLRSLRRRKKDPVPAATKKKDPWNDFSSDSDADATSPSRRRDRSESVVPAAKSEWLGPGEKSSDDPDAELWPPTLAATFGAVSLSPGPVSTSSLNRTISNESQRSGGGLAKGQEGRAPFLSRLSSTRSARSDHSVQRLRSVPSLDAGSESFRSPQGRREQDAKRMAAAAAAHKPGQGHNANNDESVEAGWPKSLQGSSLY